MSTEPAAIKPDGLFRMLQLAARRIVADRKPTGDGLFDGRAVVAGGTRIRVHNMMRRYCHGMSTIRRHAAFNEMHRMVAAVMLTAFERIGEQPPDKCNAIRDPKRPTGVVVYCEWYVKLVDPSQN